MNGIEHERAAREIAERELEQRNCELEEVTQKLNQRIETVTDQNEKLRKNTLELEQIRMRLVDSDLLATIGRLVTGLSDEISEPVNFLSNNLSSLLAYINDLGEVIDKQNSYINSRRSIISDISNTKLRQLEKFKKKINSDFLMEDGRKVIAESSEGIVRIEKILLQLADYSNFKNADLVEEDINQLLDRSLFLVAGELRY